MFRTIRSSRGAVSMLAMVLSLLLAALPAYADECETVDQNDLPRECTFMEEFGECLSNAEDSWETCLEYANGNWLIEEACDLGGAVDLLACVAALPFELIGELFD